MSFIPVSSDIRFCTTRGQDNEHVIEMRRVKRNIPTLFFDSYSDMVYNMSTKDRWVMFVNSNEVLHEDCCHFLWNFILHSSEDWDAMRFPVMNSFTGETEHPIRFLSPRAMRGNFFDGDFNLSPSLRMVESHCFPRPLWSFSEKSFVGNDAPTCVCHMRGRSTYSNAYIRKGG
jgi:hypothetical protein